MIILSRKAEFILQWYKNTYGEYKTPQEYGRSAFWLWYDQISEEIRNLENRYLPYGLMLTIPMDYWGNIIYSKQLLLGLPLIVVEDFDFDKNKFNDWLQHTAAHVPPYSICDTCFGFKTVLYDRSQKQGILKPDGNILVSPIFDDIINFHHSTNDYNTIHAIGFIGDRVYSISTNGNVTLLHMSKSDYLTMKHRYDEMIRRIIKMVLNESKTHRLNSVIGRTVHRVLREHTSKAVRT